jgi:Domain of unknown function (DUF4340)
MKLRTIVITVAILAALSVVAHYVNRPEPAPSPDPRVGTVLLDPDTVAKAASIVVSDKGKSAELDRNADGSWRVTNYFGLPADTEKISRLVQDLNEAKVDRFVTANPDRLAHLEFNDSSIVLKDAAGKEIWRLTLGKASESGNGRFIRFGDDSKAFYSGLHVWLDTDPKGWADTQLVPVKPEDVARIEVPFDGGAPVEVIRAKKDAPWSAEGTPAAGKLDESKVSSLLTSITSLRFTDTIEPKDALAAEAAGHARTFKLTTFDGKTYTVTLGRKPEEKKLKTPVSDAKEALASLGKLTDVKEDTKPMTPEFETIPAGPVFANVASPDPHAPINEFMTLRAFEVDDYVFTGLPQKPDELFEAAKPK